MPIRASDAFSWTKCRRRAWFDHHEPAVAPAPPERFDELIRHLGAEHEARVLAGLGPYEVGRDAQHTRELMSADVPLIYQGVLEDASLDLVGVPDFLVRTDLGAYHALDAKLATSIDGHREISIQIGVYRRLLANALPAVAVLKDGAREEVSVEVEGDVDRFLTGMQQIVAASEMPAADYSDSKCRECPYRTTCVPAFEAADEITLIPGVDSRSAPGLRAQGLNTVAALAAADPSAIADVPYLGGIDRKTQAVRQARALRDDAVIRRGQVVLPNGTCVHLDIEDNPQSDEPPGVYLWGLLPPPYDASEYQGIWSDGAPGSDRAAWLAFLDAVRELRRRWNDVTFVHYAHHERTKIRECAEVYGSLEDPIVAWLLGTPSPLFDLEPAVKRAFILPVRSYGLKAICKHPRIVNFKWELAESGAQWSIVRYNEYLSELDPATRAAIKDAIVAYNRDDVRASRALEMWMREVAHP